MSAVTFGTLMVKGALPSAEILLYMYVGQKCSNF